MPTLDDLIDPREWNLTRILQEGCGDLSGFPADVLDRARANLIDFCQFVDPSFQVNWHHLLIAEKLEAVGRGEIQKLMILTPPRHSKTLLCSHFFPAWLLGHQDEAIVGCSYNATKASEEAAQVQRLIAGERYQSLFPNAQIPKRSNAQAGLRQGADKFSLVGRPRANYRAVGIGGALTGFDKTLGCIDDPVKDQEEALSENKRRRVWDWYNRVYKTRDTKVIAGPRGVRDILVMTTWHTADLAGMLEEKAAAEWEIVRLPAFHTEDSIALKYPQDPRAPMEALWPGANSMADLQKLQRDDPSAFAALFQQRPSTDGGIVFHRSYFEQRYRPNELNRQRGHWFIAVDCAFEGKDTSDRVAIQVWCIDYDARRAYLVLDDTKVRDFPATIADIRTTLKAYPWCAELQVENKANGPAVIATLKKQIGQACTPFMPYGSKLARAISVQPFVRAGWIWLPENAPWLEPFLGEVCTFPRAKHDDRVDAFSMALTKLVDNPAAGTDAWDALMRRS